MIEIRQLVKRYGAKTAVDGRLRCPAWVVTGFLGPNGAGKSTTMRLIVGLDACQAGVSQDLSGVLGDPAAEMEGDARVSPEPDAGCLCQDAAVAVDLGRPWSAVGEGVGQVAEVRKTGQPISVRQAARSSVSRGPVR